MAATLVGVVAAHAFGAVGCGRRDGVRGRRHLRRGRAGPEDLGGAAHRASRPCDRSDHPAPGRVHAPRLDHPGLDRRHQRHPARARACKAGPYTSDEMLRAIADEAAEEDVIEQRGTHPHPLDHRLRRHRRPRRHGAPPGHGGRRVLRPDHRRHRHHHPGRIQPDPGIFGQGIDDIVGIVLRSRTSCGPSARADNEDPVVDDHEGGPVHAGEQAGLRAHARDAGRESSTWRSSSTSSAAPPAWSPSRT